jgi:outer membrane protein, heavy metal efflux system
MTRGWPLLLPATFLLGILGCVNLRQDPAPGTPTTPGAKRDPGLTPATYKAMETAAPKQTQIAASSEAAVVAPDLVGPQPLDVLVRHALAENRTVRAAQFNVLALKHRIPQVTTLDDPIVSNTIFPIPSVAPQYSLMGYMPYSALLAQQFPWCGTLRLRGQAAEDDVKIALFELAAAQLDVVANVKRAYYDLHFNEYAESLLKKNRALAEDFLKIARERYRGATATQVDVLRAEVAISDINRELENTSQAVNETRAELARLLHASPETLLETMLDLPVGSVPLEVERLYQLVCASRPELQGRLAAIARDEKAIELARKRYYPNLTVGLVYQDLEKTNAETPRTASGQPNVGLFVGFNLPIYHKKLAAGVQEAQARAAADGQLFEAERDQAHRDIKDFFVQARVQQNVLLLLRRNNLTTAKQVLELTAGDYTAGNAGVDFLSLLSAWRELLQVEIQIAQIEAELGKTLASLERAVGTQLNEHPPDPSAVAAPGASGVQTRPPAPAPPRSASPFRAEGRRLGPVVKDDPPAPTAGSGTPLESRNTDGDSSSGQKAGTTPAGPESP